MYVGSLLTTRTYATQIAVKKYTGKAIISADGLFKTYKPITPGIRQLRRPLNSHLWRGKPMKLLTQPLRQKGGRNNTGRITVRFRGGGHKQRIRDVDFMRKTSGPMDVVRIEYDPGRSGHIALVRARGDGSGNGNKRFAYILAAEGMRGGDVVESFRDGVEGIEDGDDTLAMGNLRMRTVKTGNVLPLGLIPTGTIIHNISLHPEGRGRLVRSAGSHAQVVAHETKGKYSQVRLQSGEVRKLLQNCCATIGRVSNPLWRYRSLGKAGRSRWLGRRPHVRGVAMNRNDHPHGGGRGKSKGNKHPRSVWGWLTKGKRTRRPGPKGPKNSNKMVIRERPRGKEKRAN